MISIGGGAELQSEYKSVIYRHQDSPRWYETFKIAVPIEEFYNCHLKFTFKHISGNEGGHTITIALNKKNNCTLSTRESQRPL